jgi:hypothetical protein
MEEAMLEDDDTKVCLRCERELRATMFPPDTRSADLLGVWCRECRRAYALERSVQPEVKVARRERERQRRLRDPEWREAERARARRNRRRSAA